MESLKITLPGEAKPRQSANGFDSYLKISFISHFQLYIDGHCIMNFVQLRWILPSSEFVVGICFSLSSQPAVCSRFCTRVRFNHYGDKVLRAARIPGSWAGQKCCFAGILSNNVTELCLKWIYLYMDVMFSVQSCISINFVMITKTFPIFSSLYQWPWQAVYEYH